MTDTDSGLKIIIKDKFGFCEIFKMIHDYLGNYCQLVFTPLGFDNNQTAGIKILQYNDDNTILVKMILNATNLYYFHCEEKYIINIDMRLLIKYITKNKPSNIITILLDKNTNSLCIDKISNVISTEINATHNMVPIPKTEFNIKLEINNDILNNIYKTMAINGCQFINIIVDNNNIIFKNENGNERKLSHNNNCSTIIDSVFDLKKLKIFCKYNISSPIDIYIKNDFPLVKVASLPFGKLYVFISPI